MSSTMRPLSIQTKSKPKSTSGVQPISKIDFLITNPVSKTRKNKNATTLSNYMWENKLGPDYIKWEILKKAPSYMNGQKFCDLCLTEKLAIARTSADLTYLNKRCELANKCAISRNTNWQISQSKRM